MEFAKYKIDITGLYKVEYPRRPSKESIKTGADARKYADLLDQYAVYLGRYETCMKEIRKRENDMRELFKHDLLEEFGLLNNPVAEKIWSYCWDKGHSGGFNDVFCCMSDLAEYKFFQV